LEVGTGIKLLEHRKKKNCHSCYLPYKFGDRIRTLSIVTKRYIHDVVGS
jgi:hypothetical protein